MSRLALRVASDSVSLSVSLSLLLRSVVDGAVVGGGLRLRSLMRECGEGGSGGGGSESLLCTARAEAAVAVAVEVEVEAVVAGSALCSSSIGVDRGNSSV